MGQKTGIEWTDCTWNPVRGCTRVSEGCRNCYAERQAARYSGSVDRLGAPLGGKDLPFHGFAENTKAGPRWTGRVELVPHMLNQPSHWKTPWRIFVNSMSDLFHEALDPLDIAEVFAVMADCDRHTFQILTKRPARMRELLNDELWWAQVEGIAQRNAFKEHPEFGHEFWSMNYAVHGPLKNVWLGISVEDQATADERIPELLATEAAVRFISYEPALGPVDFALTSCDHPHLDGTGRPDEWVCRMCGDVLRGGVTVRRGLDWLIVGGESGPGARPFDLAWARSARDECRGAGCAFFMKQLGARPMTALGSYYPAGDYRSRSRKGGHLEEMPEDLRIREFPANSRQLPAGGAL